MIELSRELPDKSMTNEPEQLLYGLPAYGKASSGQEPLCFYGLSPGGLCCRVSFTAGEHEAISLMNAPFSGIDIAPSCTHSEVLAWLQQVEKHLKSAGYKTVTLHQPPAVYGNQSLVERVLTASGYQLISSRNFHVISVNERPLTSQMSGMQLRRFRKLLREEPVFERYDSSALSTVFRQIEQWRNTVDQPVSLGKEQVLEQAKACKEHYHAFGLSLKNRLAAATVAVRVREDALYHFLPASDRELHSVSPMVGLVNGLYDWCRQQGITMLDLGSSYVRGIEKASLVRFKESLGAKASVALSWQKTLS
ncbi:GNAT family N-acetyltransferase [Roseivirga sp. UBA838]|uniref:GNAT family N-acetyltransferase n=1 Tax=Roseivirga sp. UBA838 TaxID=1947393 RepID=UPI002580C847|nr:GNAT family N-acetyltransferase [Roseivirga sp. UBA838]|tara:strand:- start:2863 stop:3786 length:924 start_codon:yes stop_codon:yes gene_type:complete